jgi:biopolymer transport protein ExbD
MNLRKTHRDKPSMHAGALNDILFILLLFFLIVSTLANPNIIKVNNPKGKSDSKTKQNIVVTIDKDNNMFLNQTPINQNNLDTIIQHEVNAIKAFMDTPSVVINADTISYSGGLFKIMNAAKKAGAKVVANVHQ